MKKILIPSVFLPVVFLIAPLLAPAEGYGSDRTGKLQAGLGIGAAFHDPAFDMRLDTEYFITNNISAGFDFDIIFHDSPAFLADAVGRYHFSIPRLSRLDPYAGAGLGGITNTNGNGGFDIEVPNIGCRYEVLADRLFIGPDLGIHILTDFSTTTWDVNLLFVNALYRF